MAVTKQKKNRLFMGLCTFENQLGWVPVQAVMFGVNEQRNRDLARLWAPGFWRKRRSRNLILGIAFSVK
jgi:hypothetical protein